MDNGTEKHEIVPEGIRIERESRHATRKLRTVERRGNQIVLHDRFDPPDPLASAWYTFIFTPDEARHIGRLLVEAADRS